VLPNALVYDAIMLLVAAQGARISGGLFRAMQYTATAANNDRLATLVSLINAVFLTPIILDYNRTRIPS
jgi:hypothetical protein